MKWYINQVKWVEDPSPPLDSIASVEQENFDQIKIRSDSLYPTTQYCILLLCKTEILINDCFAAWTVHSHAATSSVVHCWGHNPHMVCSDQVWKLLTSIFLSFFGIIWELESASSLFSLWGDIKHSTSHSQISSYSIYSIYLIIVFIHTFIPTTTYILT